MVSKTTRSLHSTNSSVQPTRERRNTLLKNNIVNGNKVVYRTLKYKLVESLRTTKNYAIVHEEDYRGKALQVALKTGSSGFDAYILALAWDRDALLITDDEPMSKHAETLGVHVALLCYPMLC